MLDRLHDTAINSHIMDFTWIKFAVKEAAQATEVPERSITFWGGPAKVITPEVASGGKGRRKLFSARNLVQLRVTYLLTQRWIGLKTVRALMETARRERQHTGTDWFQLSLGRQADPTPEEFLTCTGTRTWHMWTSALPTPPEPAQLVRRIQLGDDARSAPAAPKAPAPPAPPTRPREDLWTELEHQEDAILVNLGRVKEAIVKRLE